MERTNLPPISPEAALSDTLGFAARHSEDVLQRPETLPWLVSAVVLAAQQAAVLALRAAGDVIPAHAGATELLLRAASRDRLPPPWTLPFSAQVQREFAGLVEARNAAMHPRGEDWQIAPEVLSAGLSVAVRVIRHLVLVQPFVPGIIAPDQAVSVDEDLDRLETLSEFLAPGPGIM